MSWVAVKWAMDQDPGYPTLKWVLVGTCNFVNKRTGKAHPTPAAVAEFCNIKHRTTVIRAWEKLKDTFLLDTGERIGGNGRVVVWTPNFDTTSTQLRHNCDTTKTQLGSSQPTSFIGEVGLNLEPVTLNPDNDDSKALGSSLVAEQPNGKSSSSDSDWIKEAEKDERFPKYVAFCNSKPDGGVCENGWETYKRKFPLVKPKAKSKTNPPKRETREPSDEEFARVGKIAREALAEFKSKILCPAVIQGDSSTT